MLQIKVNNIALSLVQNSISIEKTNNEFASGFSISQTTRPLYIIENETTELALGKASLYATTQSVFKDVVVVEDNIHYKGELTVYNSYNGVRKADVKYTDVLLEHLENKIHTYFNNVPVDGATDVEYNEESTDFNDEYWVGFVQNHIPRNFPEVDFNFPTIPFPFIKSGDDAWKNSTRSINKKTLDNVLMNNETFGNRNVILPYYYLLSPLYKLFKNTLGYTITGSFVTDEINSKRLLEPQADNLVKVSIDDDTVIYKHHLTIHPERMLPSWTVAEYLNNLINQFNVKILINNITKTITINYCEAHYFTNSPLVLNNVYFTKNVPLEFSSISNYILKDASETDVVNFSLSDVTNDSEETESTTVIQTAFKAALYTLTEEWQEYNGVGLFLYDYATDNTNHLSEFNGQTNFLSGANGIAVKWWYKWFKFRLRAKNYPIKMVVSQTLKSAIENASSIYLSNQEFLVKSLKFKYEDVKNYLIELELLSKHS